MIVEMKKMKLICLSKEKERILDTLNHLKSVELKESQEIDNTHTRLNVKRLSEVQSKIAKLAFGISLIAREQKEREKLAASDIVEYTPPKKGLFTVRQDVDYDSFISSNKMEYEIFASLESLEKLNEKLTEMRLEEIRLNNLISTLNVFKDLEVPFSEVKSTRNTVVLLGTIPSNQESKLADAPFHSSLISKHGDLTSIFVCAHATDEAIVNGLLQEIGFSKTNLTFDMTPRDKIAEANAKINSFEKTYREINEQIVSFESKLDDFKLLYDYFSFKEEKIEAQGGFRRTDGEKAVFFEGWVPEPKVKEVEESLSKLTSRIHLEFADVEKGDNPPSLTKNSKLVKPFESVTNMFSAPNYHESDPNFSVMIFFFLFFGFMLSDAGYGLLMAIAGTLALKFIKMERGTKNLVAIITLGGLSTIIWGVVFGGWFAIDVSNTFLGKLTWFTPLENPLGVLGLSLGLGFLQIMWGLALKWREIARKESILSAVLDVGSWYLLFLGILMLALGLVPGFEKISSIGIYVALGGVVMLILTQGRKQKGIVKKFTKGVGSLYGLVGYLSDILSYSRLFGLGLATGVVGMVMNSIGGVFVDLIPYVGWIFAAAFILAGHTLNLGINLLGAYVHDCRLQYIEFFSRFYEGGGHLFKPLGTNTKYTVIK